MKKTILGLIMGLSITFLLTSSLAYADPTGDRVIIDPENIPTEPDFQEAVVVAGEPEATFERLDQPTSFIVDIEDGAIWIIYPEGNLEGFLYSIAIRDIDWLDESGNEVPGTIDGVRCEGEQEGRFAVPIGADWESSESGSAIIIIVDPLIFELGVPASIHCEYTVQHVVESNLVAGDLLPIDSAALFIAGIQSVSAWLVPTAAGIAATGFYLVRYRKHD